MRSFEDLEAEKIPLKTTVGVPQFPSCDKSVQNYLPCKLEMTAVGILGLFDLSGCLNQRKLLVRK